MKSDRANPFLPWFVQDFRASRKVQRMDYIAQGLYRQLLDEEFLEGPLLNDPQALAEICNCPVKVMERAWPSIKPCFIEVDGRLINAKLEGIRTERDRVRIMRAQAGRLGGLAKHAVANAKHLPDDAANSKQMVVRREEREKEQEEEDLASDRIGDPSMVCTAVLDDLRLSGQDLRIVLDEVCTREMRAGMDGQELRAALVTAWKRYEEAKPRLKFPVGAAKFFGECWRNPAGWPWRDGEGQKPVASIPSPTAIDRQVSVKPLPFTLSRTATQ